MHFQQAYDPFRALGASWGLFKRAPWVILLATVLFIVVDSTSGVGFQIQIDGNLHDADRALRRVLEELRSQAGLILGLNTCLGIPAWLFRCWLRLGFARTVRRLVSGGTADAAELFSGSTQWGAMLLGTLLRGLILIATLLPLALIVPAIVVAMHGGGAPGKWIAVASIGAVVLYVPIFLYVLLGLVLAPMAVAFEGMQATEALSRSWELAKGRRWTLFLYYLVLNVVEVVGVILCCCCGLGLIVFGITYTACFESYAQLVGAASAPPQPLGVGGVGPTEPIERGPYEPPRAD